MKVIFTIILSCIALLLKAQTDSHLIHAFSNKFSMSLPSDVDTMSAKQMMLKYHKTPDGKTIFYSDEGVNFSVVISAVADGLREDDMVSHKKDLTDPIAAKGYKMEENDVRTVNGHKIIVVAFDSDVPDGKIFNRRFFAVVDKKLIMVAFNSSTAVDLDKRKKQIEQSISSVTIK